jgi:hypothetical protein
MLEPKVQILIFGEVHTLVWISKSFEIYFPYSFPNPVQATQPASSPVSLAGRLPTPGLGL